jgi:hypothetical protein
MGKVWVERNGGALVVREAGSSGIFMGRVWRWGTTLIALSFEALFLWLFEGGFQRGNRLLVNGMRCVTLLRAVLFVQWIDGWAVLRQKTGKEMCMYGPTYVCMELSGRPKI